MDNRAITKEERLAALSRTVGELTEIVENIVRNSKQEAGCGQYLTDRELSKLLKISRRCLQDYRTEGKIPFYRIGGKILYRASDIGHFLEEHYENRRPKPFTNT